jgi:hypothetical protein
MTVSFLVLKERTVEDDGVLADDWRPGLTTLLFVWPT